MSKLVSNFEIITLIAWIKKYKNRSNTMFMAKVYLKPVYFEF